MPETFSDINVPKEETAILVIYTGGTIGMQKDSETGVLVPVNFDNISRHIPALENYNYRIDSRCFDFPIDSSDMHSSY